MAKYTANTRFSMKVQLDGRNILFAASPGDQLELTDTEHAAIVNDLPDALSPVATKKSAVKSGGTRQVTKGSKA